jgi:hypothetical protein
MTHAYGVPPVERPITRLAIETSVALAWNTFGDSKGLRPLAWSVGDALDGVHFAGDADAYAAELRCDIVESWIAALGLADQIDITDEPLHREGSNMVWIGSLDGVTFRFSYPATPGDLM